MSLENILRRKGVNQIKISKLGDVLSVLKVKVTYTCVYIYESYERHELGFLFLTAVREEVNEN